MKQECLHATCIWEPLDNTDLNQLSHWQPFDKSQINYDKNSKPKPKHNPNINSSPKKTFQKIHNAGLGVITT